MKHRPEIFALALFLWLGACTSPEGEDWPTVSFGRDVEATNAAIEKPSEVILAPLPSLLPEEREGLENPNAFFGKITADYREVAENLEARVRDYGAARQTLNGTVGAVFRDNWLTAQMELSNISQHTEELTKLRARISAMGDSLPEDARVLLRRIEAQELQNRLYLRQEKGFLASIEP